MDHKAGVVVADNRADVRSAICEYLTDEGYTAKPAASYSGAIELLRTSPSLTIALVDADIRNEQTGVALADELAQRGLRVIAMTGPQGDFAGKPYPRLDKPFHVREMLAYIRASQARL